MKQTIITAVGKLIIKTYIFVKVYNYTYYILIAI